MIYVISSIVFMYTQTFFYKKTFSVRNFERIDVVGLFRNPVVFVFSNLIVLYVKLINTLDRSQSKANRSENTKKNMKSYVCRFTVVVNFVYTSSQSEVSNLHHIIFTNQNISSRQITMDTLREKNNDFIIHFSCQEIRITKSYQRL